jgi:adenylate cyclase
MDRMWQWAWDRYPSRYSWVLYAILFVLMLPPYLVFSFVVVAVFGAPNDLADHAEAAVSAAVLIHRFVAERFGGALRIGIGVNSGSVIAGTIGGGGKLEFTLIGDTVNVAARVEQLTKTTGDAILLTHHTVDALPVRPAGLADRGFHALKGKSAAVQVFALDPLEN